MSINIYNSDVEKLLTDSDVISYFTSNNKSIFEFVKIYIEVDKVLGSNKVHSNVVYNKLDEIKNMLSNHSNQISSITTNMSNANINTINMLQSKLDNIKDITNNEIRAIFFDLQKQINNIDELKILFDTFKEKLDILNNQKLNELDRRNLDILSNMQNCFEKSLDSHQINNKIGSIETVLSSINENFSNNSAKKGQVAETVLFNILTEVFTDTEILDTSHNANSGDIQMVKENKPVILIDSKNFGSKVVPKRDLDKFYNDIQQNNCCGILCNAFGGIANKQHFEIDIIDKNIIVFIHSHQFDATLFKLATNIIYNMHQELKDKQTDSILVDQRLYQNIKVEYNYYIQTFRHHLDIIKSNVNSLSQLSFTLLDNFFKRKATMVDLKQFSCHICSAQLSTEKILKTHLKRMHGNVLPPPNDVPLITSVTSRPRGRPKVPNVNKDTNENTNENTNEKANTNTNTNVNKDTNTNVNKDTSENGSESVDD